MRTSKKEAPPAENPRLCFIVNGEDVPVYTGPKESLGIVRKKALKVSHNTGRPPEEWEIRDERGVQLPPEISFEDSGLKNKDRLFLTLQVGVGGDFAFNNDPAALRRCSSTLLTRPSPPARV